MQIQSSSNTMHRLLAVATLALAGSTAWAAGPGGPGGPGMDMPFMRMGGPAMGHMLEQAGASAEQRSQVEQIVKTAREDLRAQHEQGRALHEQMRDLFLQPAVDPAAVESVRQQMLARHDQASQRMTKAMLDVSAVLSVEQRQQLADAMRQGAQKMHDRRGRHARGD